MHCRRPAGLVGDIAPVMRHYCTYFDTHYLLRGLALYRSLKQHAEPFTLRVLCFDDVSYDVLTKLARPDLIPIALADFERGDDALLAAKATRSRVEYYFTCSPSLPLYVLRYSPEVDLITYLDADLFFYASPEPIFEEMGEASILIISHHLSPGLEYMLACGIYNVGLLSFRNDGAGRECLEWWRERCLEWCFDRVEDGKYADQKYLDDWPTRFRGVIALENSGAGLAPWNWRNYAVTVRGERVFVDGHPLIFFHYHGLKIIRSWLYDPVYAGKVYGEMPRPLCHAVYDPYVSQLKATARWARATTPEIGFAPTPLGRIYRWRVFWSKVRRGRLMLSSGLE